MKVHLLIPAVMIGLFGFSACGDSTRAGRSDSYSYYEKKEYAYEQRDSFKADMERAIDKLEARAAELRAKASQSGHELKDDTKRVIDDIEAKLPEMRRNLAEAGDATKEGWEDFKRKFHDTFDDLGHRIERAFS